eukprot:gnl/Spiro4/517_TR283_c0_g13_i1.p1 gnl/Spiro4/517_TR283_c0_g13~~gnl/Spiro4/517_TR283_c0_g13_i1.p1  ORF type:complete len:259 (+),score=28.92 gnl/Spiro4/517_TR283_c0_g13_i1:66-779(+)
MAANRFISFLVLFLALSMCFVADAKRFGKHHRRSEASVFSYDSWLDKNTKSFFTEGKMPTCCRTTDLIAPVVRDVASEIYKKFPKQQPLNIISICTGAARLEAALVATLADAGQRVKTLVVMVDEGTQESPTTVLSELTMALSSEEVKPETIYNVGWRFRDLKNILSSEFDGTADNTVVVAFNPITQMTFLPAEHSTPRALNLPDWTNWTKPSQPLSWLASIPLISRPKEKSLPLNA